MEPAEQNQLKVSVLVVSHDRIAMLRRCLESFERSEQRQSMEILVVDNGSTDGSAQLEAEFVNTRFVRIPRNFGLTKALNLGIRAASGEYIFLAHDDIEVAPETVSILAAHLDSEADLAAVCPLLVKPDGRRGPQIRELPTPTHPDPAWQEAESGADVQVVEYSAGAAFMMRAYMLKTLRTIDERYGQYGSDAELCFQISRASKKIALVPSTQAIHHVSQERAGTQVAADRILGTGVYLGKHFGFGAGLKFRIKAVFRNLLHLGLVKLLISGQKIDGTQKA